jgi:hypothetical protein
VTARPPHTFVSPRATRGLASAVLIAGVVSALAGVAYAVNGMTQAGGQVVVAAQAVDGAAFETPGGGRATVDPGDHAVRLDAPGKDRTSWLELPAGETQLRAADSTVAEQALNRGGVAVLGICLGIGGVLLRRLLLSIAGGEPFERRNATRIAVIAVLVAAGSIASDVLPAIASELVIGRTGWSRFAEASALISLPPLLAVPILLALAQAFRRGTELAADTEGLV